MFKHALLLLTFLVIPTTANGEAPPAEEIVVEPDAPIALPYEFEFKSPMACKVVVARYLVDEEKKMAMYDFILDGKRYAIRYALMDEMKKPLQIDVAEIGEQLVPLFKINADKSDLIVTSPDGQTTLLKIEDYDDESGAETDEERPISQKGAVQALRCSVPSQKFFAAQAPKFFKTPMKWNKHGIGGSFDIIARCLATNGFNCP